jgi:peptidoglycan/LPS O-acetylase OafA/YrhL
MLLRHYRPWFKARRRPIGWSLLIALGAYPKIVANPRYEFVENLVTLLVCAGVLLYTLIAPDSGWGSFLSLPGMRALGNMAYSPYLFHPILLCAFFLLIERRDPLLTTPRDLLPAATALAASLVLSYASWRLLESRLIRLGHRWKY